MSSKILLTIVACVFYTTVAATTSSSPMMTIMTKQDSIIKDFVEKSLTPIETEEGLEFDSHNRELAKTVIHQVLPTLKAQIEMPTNVVTSSVVPVADFVPTVYPSSSGYNHVGDVNMLESIDGMLDRLKILLPQEDRSTVATAIGKRDVDHIDYTANTLEELVDKKDQYTQDLEIFKDVLHKIENYFENYLEWSEASEIYRSDAYQSSKRQQEQKEEEKRVTEVRNFEIMHQKMEEMRLGSASSPSAAVVPSAVAPAGSPPETPKRKTTPGPFESPQPTVLRFGTPVRTSNRTPKGPFESPQPTVQRFGTPVRTSNRTPKGSFESPQPIVQRFGTPVRAPTGTFDSPEVTVQQFGTPVRARKGMFESPKPNIRSEPQDPQFQTPPAVSTVESLARRQDANGGSAADYFFGGKSEEENLRLQITQKFIKEADRAVAEFKKNVKNEGEVVPLEQRLVHASKQVQHLDPFKLLDSTKKQIAKVKMILSSMFVVERTIVLPRSSDMLMRDDGTRHFFRINYSGNGTTDNLWHRAGITGLFSELKKARYQVDVSKRAVDQKISNFGLSDVPMIAKWLGGCESELGEARDIFYMDDNEDSMKRPFTDAEREKLYLQIRKLRIEGSDDPSEGYTFWRNSETGATSITKNSERLFYKNSILVPKQAKFHSMDEITDENSMQMKGKLDLDHLKTLRPTTLGALYKMLDENKGNHPTNAPPRPPGTFSYEPTFPDVFPEMHDISDMVPTRPNDAMSSAPIGTSASLDFTVSTPVAIGSATPSYQGPSLLQDIITALEFQIGQIDVEKTGEHKGYIHPKTFDLWVNLMLESYEILAGGNGQASQKIVQSFLNRIAQLIENHSGSRSMNASDVLNVATFSQLDHLIEDIAPKHNQNHAGHIGEGGHTGARNSKGQLVFVVRVQVPQSIVNRRYQLLQPEIEEWRQQQRFIHDALQQKIRDEYLQRHAEWVQRQAQRYQQRQQAQKEANSELAEDMDPEPVEPVWQQFIPQNPNASQIVDLMLKKRYPWRATLFV